MFHTSERSLTYRVVLYEAKIFTESDDIAVETSIRLANLSRSYSPAVFDPVEFNNSIGQISRTTA